MNVIPANPDAEKTILGAVLLDNAALEDAAARLQASDLWLDSHQRIFQRMVDLARDRRPIDIVSLAEELNRNNEIVKVGGVAYLASLTEGLPRRPVIEEYIRIVKDKSLARRIMSICSAAIAQAQSQNETALDTLGSAMNRLAEAEHSALGGDDLESVGQWLGSNDIFAERKRGIQTGITDYDELTWGLHPGELTIVAARTSMGKTSHAGTLTWQVASRGHSVAVFLNEQAKASFIGRMLCGKSHVSFSSYRRGTLGWYEKQAIEEAREEFRKVPIFWEASAPMVVSSIRGKSRRLKRSGELDLIIIDQLSGISDDGFREKGKRGDEIIGEKTRALKNIAIDLDVPVVLYHQLNRASLRNQDARPTLGDLRGSGEIEQNADNVAFLHRPGYHDRKSEESGKDLIILAKQRDGATGDCEVEFIQEYCRWQDRRKDK